MDKAGFDYFSAQDPDLSCVVDAGGRAWSRAELSGLARGLARAFAAAGLEPGAALVILAPNCAEFLAAYLAGIEAGLEVVPVNWHWSLDELGFVLRDCEADAIVAHERLGAQRLAAIAAQAPGCKLLLALGRVPGFMALEEAVAATSAAPAARRRPMGRIMSYTSATTGRPKAVKLPRANAEAALARTIRRQQSFGIALGDDNVHLCSSMLYHSAPLQAAITSLHMGHRVILIDRWQARELLELIERHRVTTAFMVPTMFLRLLKLPDTLRGRYSTASLRFVSHGGAPCPVEVKRRMLDWWGPIIWEAYGAAEGQGTIASPMEWLARPGTVGRPMPGSAVKILDEQGRELPPFAEGLVYFRPYTGDRFEYRNDPEQTAQSYRGDFITVGDLGYLDAEGYLFLCDRRTDLIISAGVNIYPAEIEAELVQHPLVRDGAVVAMSDELLGAVPRAIVTLEAGVCPGAALSADILAYLSTRLSAVKLPRRIDYAAELPRDPSGKLYRRALRTEGGRNA